MSKYVVYKLTLPDGKFYIGKTNNLERRIQEHRKCVLDDVNLKNNSILENGGFFVEILYEAPLSLSNDLKEICIDNMERKLIHEASKKVYNEITQQDTNFIDYTPFKSIINEKLINTKIY